MHIHLPCALLFSHVFGVHVRIVIRRIHLNIHHIIFVILSEYLGQLLLRGQFRPECIEVNADGQALSVSFDYRSLH